MDDIFFLFCFYWVKWVVWGEVLMIFYMVFLCYVMVNEDFYILYRYFYYKIFLNVFMIYKIKEIICILSMFIIFNIFDI